jgi:ferredoxin
MRYRIEIDRDSCVGDGMCCEEAPGTFMLDEDSVAELVDPEGDPPARILAAAQGCALDCIALYDAETDEKIWPES